MRNGIFIGIVVAIVTILWPHNAHANYIDPSAGGILLQVVFGGLAGIAVLVKIFWHQITFFLGRMRFVRHRSRIPQRESQALDGQSAEADEI